MGKKRPGRFEPAQNRHRSKAESDPKIVEEGGLLHWGGRATEGGSEGYGFGRLAR